jgi:hypothetical protein
MGKKPEHFYDQPLDENEDEGRKGGGGVCRDYPGKQIIL